MKPIPESVPDLSLYLHIPFCSSRCTYCAFNTYTTLAGLIPAYINALCNELRQLGAVCPTPLHTIYFGGGTPSLLSAAQIGQVLATCRAHFSVRAEAEITLEVNPRSQVGDEDYLAALFDHGVNRLSVGMQSAHASELALFQRDHGVAEVAATIQRARRAGFTNLNLDLIYGIPQQTLDMWQTSLQTMLALAPKHVSLYALQLEPGTPLFHQVEHGHVPRPNDDLAADMYELADQHMQAAGLAQYEISNWAQEGYACRHNLQYWRRLPYLGLGAGAHGFIEDIRYEVMRNVPDYVRTAAAQQVVRHYPLVDSIVQRETVTERSAMAEYMMTGLRLVHEGINTDDFAHQFKRPIEDVYGEPITRFIRYELLTWQANWLRLTPQARLLSNQIFVEFF